MSTFANALHERRARDLEMASESELPKYTWEEISKHKDRNSLWLVFEGKVYDVTSFVDDVSQRVKPYVHAVDHTPKVTQPLIACSTPVSVVELPLCPELAVLSLASHGLRQLP